MRNVLESRGQQFSVLPQIFSYTSIDFIYGFIEVLVAYSTGRGDCYDH